MSGRDLEAFAKAIGPVIKRAIVKATAPLEARIAELEARQRNMKYQGPWKAKQTYAEGSFVSSGGSVFCALEDTDSKPGTDGTWQLAVKKGRDGRHVTREAA